MWLKNKNAYMWFCVSQFSDIECKAANVCTYRYADITGLPVLEDIERMVTRCKKHQQQKEEELNVCRIENISDDKRKNIYQQQQQQWYW